MTKHVKLGRTSQETLTDPFSHLLSGAPSYRNTYAYDDAGNRSQATQMGQGTIHYGADGLNRYYGSNYYETGTGRTNGNTTDSAVGYTYFYDAENQLVEIRPTSTKNDPNTKVAGFAYDGLGRLTAQVIEGAFTRFYYAGAQRIEERGFNNALSYLYFFDAPGSDALLFRESGNWGRLWYLSDLAGSTTHLTDDGGNVVEAYLYDAYGTPDFYTPTGGPRGGNVSHYDNRYLWHGASAYEWLQSTGLYYCRARFYLPQHGRFLQPDPIGQEGGLNLYSYCENDPVNGDDPSGLASAPKVDPSGGTGDKLTQYYNDPRWGLMNSANPGTIGGFTRNGGLVTIEGKYFQDAGSRQLPGGTLGGFLLAMGGTGAMGGGAVAGNGESASGGSKLVPLDQGLKAFGEHFHRNYGQATEFVQKGSMVVAWGTTGAVALGATVVAAEAIVEADILLPKCFALGTKVFTSIGEVKIEDIKKGDLVYSFDFSTSQIVTRQVLDIIENFTYYWADVRVDGEVIRATRSHPFWIESEQQWVEAADLKKGMMVRLKDGNTAAIDDVSIVRVQQVQPTYNLEVDVNHNYFVGHSRILVHNGDGSYTLTFASGKQYVGKGDLSRAADSAARITKQTGDRLVDTKWTPANGKSDSFVQEEMRMRSVGGPGGSTYNKINSPGNKISEKNGCP